LFVIKGEQQMLHGLRATLSVETRHDAIDALPDPSPIVVDERMVKRRRS